MLKRRVRRRLHPRLLSKFRFNSCLFMIVHQEPGMLFAMHLFRPRGRAASRRANILFMDMAAEKKRKPSIARNLAIFKR